MALQVDTSAVLQANRGAPGHGPGCGVCRPWRAVSACRDTAAVVAGGAAIGPRPRSTRSPPQTAPAVFRVATRCCIGGTNCSRCRLPRHGSAHARRRRRGSQTGARGGFPAVARPTPRSNKSVAHVQTQGSGIGWSHRCGGWIAWHTTCSLVARDPAHRGIRIRPFDSKLWRLHMKWTTPSYTEMRFGFEVTMYIANR